MASVSEEIFTDKYTKKPEEESEPDLTTEFPKIPDTEPEAPEIPPDDSWQPDSVTPDDSKGSRKKGIIGAIVIGLIIGGAVYGAQAMGYFGESEPFDASECHYGVASELFSTRCMTEEEFIEAGGFEKSEDDKPIPVEDKPSTGSGGTKDVSSTSDKVELEKTNDPIGYYLIKSNDDWYGDFVDFRKVPSKIENSGDMKISFRCFTDDFAGTSTYFATFRNVVQNNLQADVYIGDKLVESKVTETNKALILEGSCY